jgi:hypothetical protein
MGLELTTKPRVEPRNSGRAVVVVRQRLRLERPVLVPFESDLRRRSSFVRGKRSAADARCSLVIVTSRRHRSIPN